MCGVLIALIGLGGVIYGGLLTFLGFTNSGVAAGSVAAAIQSVIGNVAAGSVFAKATSLGALGTNLILAFYGGLGLLFVSLAFCISVRPKKKPKTLW